MLRVYGEREVSTSVPDFAILSSSTRWKYADNPQWTIGLTKVKDRLHVMRDAVV